MTTSYFNEMLNGVLMCLAFFATMIFVRYVFVFRKYGWDYLRAPTSILIMLLGEGIVRVTFWWARHLINVGDLTEIPLPFYIFSTIGGIIQGIGLIMISSTFAPERCGVKSWTAAFAIAFIWTFGWMFLDYYF